VTSPYENRPTEDWRTITEHLVDNHPLKTDVILDAAKVSWDRLWNSTVGDTISGFKLSELDPPATIVGYFFEKIFAKELSRRFPQTWIGGKGSQKDLHCLTDDSMSVEIKSSGQLGYKIYGNRSYGQKVENEDAAKKDKSGYYITVNFYGQTLTLLRFGWIDSHDWQAQKSATGQMAGLSDDTYKHKLLTISDEYMLRGPIQLIDGVGAKAAADLCSHGFRTIRDLVSRSEKDVPKQFLRHWTKARKQFQEIIQKSEADSKTVF